MNKEGKQPWLKFYPGDWRGDLTLGPCSLAARGLWMEMLCMMSDAIPRGSLVKEGQPYTVKQISAVARASVKDVEKLMSELEAEGVFSRDADGTIYSRRMRRDTAKAEQDKANGRSGGNPNLKPKDNGGVNPHDNPPDKAQKLEARGYTPDPKSKSSLRSDSAPAARGREKDFDRFWGLYPKRTEIADARKALDEALDRGATIDEIVAGARRFAPTVAGREAQFIASPVRWLRGERWKDGLKANGQDEAPASVFVRTEDPRFDALADRHQREHGSRPRDIGQGGRAFPSAWIAEMELAS